MEYTIEYLFDKYYHLLPRDDQYLLEEVCYKEDYNLGDYVGYCEICKKYYNYEYFKRVHLKTKHIKKHNRYEDYLIDSVYAKIKEL